MNTKEIKRRKFFIKSLMISTQILLTGFVIFWLIEQYKGFEKSLQKELTYQFVASQNKILDSLIVKNVLNPIFVDSIEVMADFSQECIQLPIKHSMQSTTINLDDDSIKGAIVHIETMTVDSNKIVTLKSNSDSCVDQNLSDLLKLKSNNQDELVKRGIKLIISQTHKFLSSDSVKAFTLSGNKESVLLKQAFSDDLSKKGMAFKLEWRNTDNDTLNQKTKGIYIKSNYSDRFSDVKVSGYKSHILGMMIPQFLFVLLLLGISGFAFYFTYYNLKKQYSLNELRNSFISNITHELKTPVATVMVALEALKSQDLKKDYKIAGDYLNMISDETQRLNALIAKVMTHSRLSNKAIVFNKEQTDLVALTKEVIEKAEFQRNNENNIFDFQTSAETIWINIDRVYIFGVIFNLIDNSIKYTGENVHIQIKIKEEGNFVHLSVSDNGPGVAEEHLPKLFDTFFRIPQGNKHNVKGYGLGLSYAKLVMEEHGGTISAKNLTEGGCCFMLTFNK